MLWEFSIQAPFSSSKTFIRNGQTFGPILSFFHQKNIHIPYRTIQSGKIYFILNFNTYTPHVSSCIYIFSRLIHNCTHHQTSEIYRKKLKKKKLIGIMIYGIISNKFLVHLGSTSTIIRSTYTCTLLISNLFTAVLAMCIESQFDE